MRNVENVNICTRAHRVEASLSDPMGFRVKTSVDLPKSHWPQDSLASRPGNVYARVNRALGSTSDPMGFRVKTSVDLPKSHWLKRFPPRASHFCLAIEHSVDSYPNKTPLPANDDLGYGDFGWIFTSEDRRQFVHWSDGSVEDSDVSPEQMEQFGIMQELNRQKFHELTTDDHYRDKNLRLRLCNTMHKRVADKVRPVDDPRATEPMEFGRPDWRERAIQRQNWRERSMPRDVGPVDHLFERRHSPFPRGTRCTPERLANLTYGDHLWPGEIAILQQMLLNREGALAWEWSESGRFTEDVCPPYRIRTIEHKAWQCATFRPPKKLEVECMDMIRDRLARGTLELCDSQYRNPWFLVPKKDQKLRLINNAQHMNAVTIRDANLPPSADDFAEKYAGCKVLTIMDFFSGYDHITLHPDSRDMTAFYTPMGLVRMCTMVQGATNSPGAFLRVVMKVLARHLPLKANAFIDDVVCGGSRDTYNDEQAYPGIRRFMLEHFQELDQVLYDVELAGGTIKAPKSEWGMRRMAIVGFEVDEFGRYPMKNKVDKVRDWPECRSVNDVRRFIGLAVYYRIWIFCFAIKARPLFMLLRNDAEWSWTDEHRAAMATIKNGIISAPALGCMDYENPPLLTFVSVDASAEGGGAVLAQMGRDGKRHPIRFESTLWSASESKWHSTKLECRAVVWALKKFRVWIYGIHFHIETDAQTLIAQLNRTSSEVPGSLMNRWLAYILLWDFEIRHVPGKKNVVADALSRYPKPEGWTPPDVAEDDELETFINNALMNISTSSRLGDPYEVSSLIYGLSQCNVTSPATSRILGPEYSDESEAIAVFLTTTKKPSHLTREQKAKWGRKAMTFYTEKGHLFKKSSRNISIRRVVDDPDMRRALIWEIHQQTGHRGANGAHSVLAQRYWWNGMYEEVKSTLQSCKDCQIRSARRKRDMLTTTYSWTLWEWITIDIVYMPPGLNGKMYLVLGREYISGWVEGRALTNNTSAAVAKFIYEEFICRWSMSRKITVDGGPENKKVVADLAEIYGIRRIQTSAYNPQAQGFIEGGHKPIVNALAKLKGNWVSNLHTALWADRCSIHESTGYSPIQLVTGQNPVLPVELCVPTWQTLPWHEVRTRDQLIAIRAMQLDLRDEHLAEAIGRVARLRGTNKEYWDTTKDIDHDVMRPGDMVLLWDSLREIDMSRSKKLHRRWLGPYRIRQTWPNRNYYLLEDLDGTPFRETSPGHKVKKFIQRSLADIEQTDRGHVKLWDAAKWPARHRSPISPAP